MSDARPRPSIERITAFKEVINCIVDGYGEDSEDGQWFLRLASALCWASGCKCPGGEHFETQILKIGHSMAEQGGMTDKKGKPVDVERLLKAMAFGFDQATE